MKVLGDGCDKCNALEKNVKEVLSELGMTDEIDHVTDFGQIAAMGVMSTPALVIDNKVLFISKIQLPSGVQDVMDMMNNMIGPIGMLLAGMVIADVPLKTVFTKKRNYVSTVLRLIVYPIFVLILMKLIYTFTGLNDSKQILLTVYIASITPACATVTSMAQLYDKDAAYASSLYVLTTLLSIVTMPVMVGMYEMFV